MASAPDPGGGAYPAADAWSGISELRFSTGTKIILVWTHNNRLVIRFAFDGVTYGDDIVLYDAPQAEPLYMSALSCQVINYLPGATAVYQIMGQW